MAIRSSTSDFAGSTSASLAKPTGLANGDVVVIAAQNAPAALTLGLTVGVNTPTGFTPVDSITIDNKVHGATNRNVAGALFDRVIDGTESWPLAVAGTVAGGATPSAMFVICVALSGRDTTTPIAGHSVNSGDNISTVTALSVAATAANTDLLAFALTWETDRGPFNTTTEFINAGGAGMTGDSAVISSASGNLTCAADATETWVALMISVAPAVAGATAGVLVGSIPQPAIPYGYTIAKGAPIAPAVATPQKKIYGSQPQAPSAFFGASLVITGLISAPKASQIIYGSALQTSEYGSSRVVAVPAAPTAPQLRGVIGSTLRAEDFVPYYGGTQVIPGSVYTGVAVSAQSISARYLPQWNDYGSARTIPGLAPPAIAPPVIYGSSAQPTSYLGSAVCIRGLTPTPQAIYGSALKPTSDYGSARAISALAPATQPPTPQMIYGSEPQIISDYGTTRIIAGLVPLAVLLPTIYGPDAPQPTDYGYARAIKGLVPAPSALPPTIYRAQLEQPSAFVGLSTVVKGLAPAAQGAPPKVVSSTPQPPMLYGWSTYVKGTPAVIVPLQTIYGSRVNVSQDYGSARFIAGLMPAPIAAQTIFGPDALPVEAYGSARVIVGLVPAAVLPPTIYGSAPRPLHIDGLSRPVVGTIPAPLQLQRVYGAAPLQTAEYGLARFVRGLIPVIAVLPPTIYGSAPEQVSYYGGVVIVPGLKPKHGAIGCAIATDEQIAFALASDTCGCDL